MKAANMLMKGLLVLILGIGLVGCDFLEDTLGDEKEAQGIVEAIGESTLTVDGIEYRITSETEFEGTGLTGLADLEVGQEVEIEYEEQGGTRVALEVELAGAEDDD